MSCSPNSLFCPGCDQRHVYNGDRCHLLLPNGKCLSPPQQSCSRAQSCPISCADHHEASPSTSIPHRNSSREEEHCPRYKGTWINLTSNMLKYLFLFYSLFHPSFMEARAMAASGRHSLWKAPSFQELAAE